MANNNSNHSKSKIQPLHIVMLIFVIGFVALLGYISLSTKTEKETDTVKDIRGNNLLFAPTTYSEEQIAKDSETLESMFEGINTYQPKNLTTVPGIVNEINAFKFLISDANAFANKYSTDTSFTNKVKKISEILVQKQKDFFPVFRASYSKIANKVMIEADITSVVSGSNNIILELTGDRYLDTANVRIDYSLLLPHLENLRYKQVIFRIKEDNKIVRSYNVNSLNDDVIF